MHSSDGPDLERTSARGVKADSQQVQTPAGSLRPCPASPAPQRCRVSTWVLCPVLSPQHLLTCPRVCQNQGHLRESGLAPPHKEHPPRPHQALSDLFSSTAGNVGGRAHTLTHLHTRAPLRSSQGSLGTANTALCRQSLALRPGPQVTTADQGPFAKLCSVSATTGAAFFPGNFFFF